MTQSHCSLEQIQVKQPEKDTPQEGLGVTLLLAKVVKSKIVNSRVRNRQSP